MTKPSTQKPPPLSLAEVPEIDRFEPSRSVLRSCKMKRNAAETGKYLVHCESRKRFGKELQQSAWSYHLLRFAVRAQVACMEAAPVLRPRPLHLQQRMQTILAEFRCTSAKLTHGSPTCAQNPSRTNATSVQGPQCLRQAAVKLDRRSVTLPLAAKAPPRSTSPV